MLLLISALLIITNITYGSINHSTPLNITKTGSHQIFPIEPKEVNNITITTTDIISTSSSMGLMEHVSEKPDDDWDSGKFMSTWIEDRTQ